MRNALYLLLVLALLPPTFAKAEVSNWRASADLSLQARLFAEQPRWDGQAAARGQVSLQGSAEVRWRNDEGTARFAFVPFARWDERDPERNLLDLREAYWAWNSDSIELLVGLNTVFWGVTESVHLVDIINQTDTAGDIDGEQKLGQPMLNLSLQRDWGQVSLFLMPYFRERTFPGAAGRFRFPLPIDDARSRYGSSDGEHHVDVALRYSHFIGDIDLGLSFFSGTSREPNFVPADNSAVLLPRYELIDQAALDLQYTRDAWLWKLEAILRNGADGRFAALVGGFEHTWFQVRDGDADLGLLIEYQYDGRDAGEPPSLSDNDLFVGMRLALNDIQDTAILAGMVRDLDTGETLFNIEAERRIGDAMVVELRGRAFTNAARGDAMYAVARDDYVQLQLTRYF